MRCRALLAKAPAVIEAHDALYNSAAGAFDSAVEGCAHAVSSHHPWVEVIGRPPEDDAVQSRVYVGRPCREGLHDEIPAAQCLEYAEGDERLARAARCA